MENRKLIKLGNSSFAIALPKDWVDKAGLKKGDEIFLERNGGGELIISSAFRGNPGTKNVELDMSKKNISSIRKEIISAYNSGANTLSISGVSDKAKISEIKDFLRNLLSFEVIDSSEGKIIAKDYFNMENANLDNFMKRMDNNIKEMFGLIDASIERGLAKKDLEEIRQIDMDTTKFHFLISRLFFNGINNPSLLNSFKKDSLEFFRLWWLSQNLERIGDSIKNISKLITSSKQTKADVVVLKEILTKIKEVYENSIVAYNSHDKAIASNYVDIGKEIIGSCEKLSQHKNPDIAKLAIALKELETTTYQNLKMTLYSEIK